MGESLRKKFGQLVPASPARARPETAASREGVLDLSFVLRVACVLAFADGLLDTVNSIPVLGLAELASWFARAAASSFVGIAPGLALLLLLERWFPAPAARRWLSLAASVVLAATLATALQMTAAAAVGVIRPPFDAWDWAFAASSQTVWILIVAVWREALAQRRSTIAALHQSEVRVVDTQAKLAEAELQMLQAQIEPHFLFNSLANVRRLARLDPAAGKAMLADLLQYLEEALPHLRQSDSTLEREAEVARAFLAVHKIRMGARLDVEFSIPEELEPTPVPPMMLLTLVENALKHGLAPLPEGGRIRIAAQRENGAVRLSVADTGRGIVPGRGTGTGLTNIRARLRGLYGARASLHLQTNSPRGVVASIVVPSR